MGKRQLLRKAQDRARPGRDKEEDDGLDDASRRSGKTYNLHQTHPVSAGSYHHSDYESGWRTSIVARGSCCSVGGSEKGKEAQGSRPVTSRITRQAPLLFHSIPPTLSCLCPFLSAILRVGQIQQRLHARLVVKHLVSLLAVLR
eukprot:766259-Hanusia_phi.AAC.5